jgi:hypothetical protein
MTVMHDWRVWMAVLAAGALLLAGAVASATSGFPYYVKAPSLPFVVTARPVDTVASLPKPPAMTVPATTTAPAVAASSTTPPAPAVKPSGDPKPDGDNGSGSGSSSGGTATRPKPAPTPPKSGSREVVQPKIREESFVPSDEDKSSSAVHQVSAGDGDTKRSADTEKPAPESHASENHAPEQHASERHGDQQSAR